MSLSDKEKAILRLATKILEREIPEKYRCEDFVFDCPQCHMSRIVNDLRCLARFITDDE
jgi:hypothetical protein